MQRCMRSPGQTNRGTRFAGKTHDATDVVTMFMGHQDGIETFGVDATGFNTRQRLSDR